MTATLISIGGSLLLLILSAVVRWWVNRLLNSERAKVKELEAQIADLTKQLEDQKNAPRNPADLADRLRAGGM